MIWRPQLLHERQQSDFPQVGHGGGASVLPVAPGAGSLGGLPLLVGQGSGRLRGLGIARLYTRPPTST